MNLAALATLLASLASGDDLWEPPSYRRIISAEEVEAAPAPAALPVVLADDEPASFSIGPEGGYLHARDADRGTWFGGAKARLHLLRFLAAEASITFHQNHYADGDIVVTQYPVQLTAFLYIIPVGPIRPYILGGVGWYYTRTDYKDSLSAINDTTDHFFGVHLGAGAEIMLGKSASIDADVRYIFINATTQQVLEDRNFNYWQITFGLNFYF
ncbi:MAG TPA: OmpW family outer membrane protein [Planctomycetota bacterium]|nr:OmpW family outer membrane protein [Planctomycetota bacterium]